VWEGYRELDVTRKQLLATSSGGGREELRIISFRQLPIDGSSGDPAAGTSHAKQEVGWDWQMYRGRRVQARGGTWRFCSSVATSASRRASSASKSGNPACPLASRSFCSSAAMRSYRACTATTIKCTHQTTKPLRAVPGRQRGVQQTLPADPQPAFHVRMPGLQSAEVTPLNSSGWQYGSWGLAWVRWCSMRRRPSSSLNCPFSFLILAWYWIRWLRFCWPAAP
jgi:hypothetical protein